MTTKYDAVIAERDRLEEIVIYLSVRCQLAEDKVSDQEDWKKRAVEGAEEAMRHDEKCEACTDLLVNCPHGAMMPDWYDPEMHWVDDNETEVLGQLQKEA